MLNDWDPDDLYDERRPPSEDPLDVDGVLEPDEQAVEDAMFGEPQDEVEDWLNGPEPDEAMTAAATARTENEADDWSPMRRAVLVGATAAVGAAVILIAVLRRRG
ncbi:hypothetical protein [Microlunatus sp. GCM10028923]|uniref:hypothetical protein n=1 Tax=Microlunatus sp. GCM10028923 TaxID=3273400 RepID=UPI00361529E7